MTRKPTAPAAETSPDVAAADLETLREEAAACRACPLWKDATQTVIGEGPDHAPLMLVGEQPGDKEDLAGHPFVGPAGQMREPARSEAADGDCDKGPPQDALEHWMPVPDCAATIAAAVGFALERNQPAASDGLARPAPTTGRPGRLTCRKPIVIDAHAFLYEVEANTG